MAKGGPFDTVRVTRPKRNYFDLSFVKAYTCGFSDLIPVLCQECLPGDKMRIGNEYVVRMQPLVAPVLSQITFYTEYFFVPNRILWDDWSDFITAGKDGTLEPAMPVFSDADKYIAFKVGSIYDYFNLPTGWHSSGGGSVVDHPDYWSDSAYVPDNHNGNWLPSSIYKKISVLAFRAYLKIWNCFYRDENLQDDLDDTDGITPIKDRTSIGDFSLRQRGWHKDYFAASLPWPQRGIAPAIDFNFSGSIPFSYDSSYYDPVRFLEDSHGVGFSAANHNVIVSDTHLDIDVSDDAMPVFDKYFGAKGSDGRASASAVVNRGDRRSVSVSDLQLGGFDASDIRLLMQTQLFLERSARFGSRLNEFLLAHFGIAPSDKTLQEPEFIGNSRSSIVVSEVLQTSATEEGGSPLGTQGGRGVGVTINKIGTYTASEHGFIIGLASIQPPRRQYEAQGIAKEWTRSSRFDYYFPEFANLSEQPVFRRELFASPLLESDPESIFGYMPIYSEYRSNSDVACGQFRHFAPQSLDYWTTSTFFNLVAPYLNESFILPDKSQLNRIFQVQDEDGFLVHFRNNIDAWRPVVPSGLPLSLVRF